MQITNEMIPIAVALAFFITILLSFLAVLSSFLTAFSGFLVGRISEI